MSGTARKVAKRSPRAAGARLGASAAVLAAWPDDVANTLARRIFYAREVRGLSQAALAALAGVSESAVSDAEGGQVVMDMRTLVSLAAALNVAVGVLLGEVPRSAELVEADEARRRF
jgi:ribosome-binding protein aMBF1 (putative translation factor)